MVKLKNRIDIGRRTYEEILHDPFACKVTDKIILQSTTVFISVYLLDSSSNSLSEQTNAPKSDRDTTTASKRMLSLFQRRSELLPRRPLSYVGNKSFTTLQMMVISRPIKFPEP